MNMTQYILLQSYTGPSHFIFEVTTTGRKLGLDEALNQGLMRRDELVRYRCSNYAAGWYEVSPGDKITVEYVDFDDDTDDLAVFVVPENGLPGPPVSLDDDRVGYRFFEYLEGCCHRCRPR